MRAVSWSSKIDDLPHNILNLEIPGSPKSASERVVEPSHMSSMDPS